MTYNRLSWKRVAAQLAQRLEHATTGHCEKHKDPTEIEAANCPFCEDILAYRAYQRRLSQELYP